jgi:hypothetical protein
MYGHHHGNRIQGILLTVGIQGDGPIHFAFTASANPVISAAPFPRFLK